MDITLHIPSDLLDQVTLLSIVAGVLALIDGILRTRFGSRLLGIIEIVASVLVLASIFLDFHVQKLPLQTLAIILEIVLIIATVFRRRMRRGSLTITLIALVVNSLLVLVLLGWLTIPFLHH